MTWSEIIIAIIVIIIIIIIALHVRKHHMYNSALYGYFVNKELPGAIFPQTGEPILLARFAGNYAIVEKDATGAIVPRRWSAYSDRVIVAPGINKQNISPLYLCKDASETIDALNTAQLIAITDTDTKLPVINVGTATAGTTDNWRFVRVLGCMDDIRKTFGLPARNIFVEMPATFPAWASSTAFAKALKENTFTGQLENVKYPSLKYPDARATIKRWSSAGLVITGAKNVLLVPTLTELTFRVFDMSVATPNAKTGVLEGYTQLVAKNGSLYDFTKAKSDTDSARWKLNLY